MAHGLGLKWAWLGLCVGCGPLVGSGGAGSEGAGETESASGPMTTPGTTPDPSTTTSTTTSPDPTTDDSGADSTTCSTACGDDDGQDSLSFIDECDAAGFGLTHCSSTEPECDPWSQDCPEGEKCQPWSNDGDDDWDVLRCAPLEPSGAGEPGDPCMVEGSGVSGVDDCGLGSLCWHVDPETNEGTCIAMCTGSPDTPVCDDPERACAMTNDGALNLCLSACDPFLQDCSDGEGCYPLAGDPSVAMFVCAPTGNGMTIDDRHPTHCEPGTVDVGNDLLSTCEEDADPCCATLCNLAAPACAEGLTCTPYYDEADLPPGLEDIGVCLG